MAQKYIFIAISFFRNILCNNALSDCYSDQAIALESKSQSKNHFQINFHQIETKGEGILLYDKLKFALKKYN